MSALTAAMVGGILIGLSSVAMLARLGRITGISGIFAMAAGMFIEKAIQPKD